MFVCEWLFGVSILQCKAGYSKERNNEKEI
jgi:hypothetical protein